jgi:hypothetical protein
MYYVTPTSQFSLFFYKEKNSENLDVGVQSSEKKKFMDLIIQSFGVKFLHGRVFFYNDLRTYFTDQDYRSHKLITWSGQEITN